MTDEIKKVNPTPHSMDHLVTAIVILAVIIPIGADMTGIIEDRTSKAEDWCQETFQKDYKGLANIQAFVDGGAHCMLENNTWINVPENLSEVDT